MVDIRAKGNITVGRDMTIVDQGGLIHPQTVDHGGVINPLPLPKRSGPITRLIQALVDIGKNWKGSVQDEEQK